MILYNPLDGEAVTTRIPAKPKSCFLMTMLGEKVPSEVVKMRNDITKICDAAGFKVFDATADVTGRDFLLKIWKMIYSSPIAIGIIHEDMPESTRANIFYEIGIAQAMGKETVIIKNHKAKVPSDFIRSEYIDYGSHFISNLDQYMKTVSGLSDHYELVAEQIEKDPVLSIDYLRRAFLISGQQSIKKKINKLVLSSGDRAGNSVERLAFVGL